MRLTRRWIAAGVAGALLLVAGVVVAQRFFLPERSTRVDEAMPLGDADAVAAGAFSGKTGHHVSGTVKLLRTADGYQLRFEDYEQTQGPDVFVYLTPSRAPSGTSDVESGLRVLLDGGADGGESTKEGSFNQRLPAGFDPSRFDGVAIWCDRFNVLFGSAPLDAT